MPGLLSCCVVLSVGRFSLQARPIIGWWNNKSTPNFIFFRFFRPAGKARRYCYRTGLLPAGRFMGVFSGRFGRSGRMCGRADYLTGYTGELPDVRNVRNVRSRCHGIGRIHGRI